MKRILISIIIGLFIFTTSGCSHSKGVDSEDAILNEEIYPRGDLISAKIIDENRNEKSIELNQSDIEFIMDEIERSNREQLTSYDVSIEINILFSDSEIQLLRKDSDVVYYVFHDKEINGVCYQVQSEKLSEWVLDLLK